MPMSRAHTQITFLGAPFKNCLQFLAGRWQCDTFHLLNVCRAASHFSNGSPARLVNKINLYQFELIFVDKFEEEKTKSVSAFVRSLCLVVCGLWGWFGSSSHLCHADHLLRPLRKSIVFVNKLSQLWHSISASAIHGPLLYIIVNGSMPFMSC